ncbi:MAG: M48 family metalloprotease [Rhodospirillales bacterium]
MRFHFFYALALCAPLLAAGGCTVNPATGEQNFTAFMSRADEIEAGKKEHPKILKQFGGVYPDKELGDYVRRIGLSLARVSEVTDLPYTFTVLNDDKVNAMAMPGGYVYITRGLLALAGDEAEMAGVLAHEIGHITARHTAQRYSQAMAANLGLTIIGILGVLPPGAGNLVSYGAQAVIQGYSREQELESDMLAVRYLARAGYDTAAMSGFFRKMEGHEKLRKAMAQNPGAKDPYNIMSSHPRTVQRIEQAVKLAGATPAKNPKLGRDEFLASIDGMVFGDDLSQGVSRGRVFAHPGLGVLFKVPPGFVMFNSAKQLIARGPGGAAIVFDMADSKKAPRIGDLRRYLISDWGGRHDMRNVERIQINSMEAATGSTRRRSANGSIEDLRLVAIRETRDKIYRFVFLSPTSLTARMEREFQRTTYSFRKMSKSEAAAVRPLRIRILMVKPGDTIEGLSANMPIEKFAKPWFELLNGLNPGQPLAPGRKVKVIAE